MRPGRIVRPRASTTVDPAGGAALPTETIVRSRMTIVTSRWIDPVFTSSSCACVMAVILTGGGGWRTTAVVAAAVHSISGTMARVVLVMPRIVLDRGPALTLARARRVHGEIQNPQRLLPSAILGS